MLKKMVDLHMRNHEDLEIESASDHLSVANFVHGPGEFPLVTIVDACMLPGQVSSVRLSVCWLLSPLFTIQSFEPEAFAEATFSCHVPVIILGNDWLPSGNST